MARRSRRPENEALFSSHIYRGPQHAEHYRNFLRDHAGDEALAFVDESYRAATTQTQGYYTLTAAVVANADIPLMREALKAQAGGTYWHTTEAFSQRSPEQASAAGVWIGNIGPMLEVTSDHIDQGVITVHTAVPPWPEDRQYRQHRVMALEEARTECMTTLLKNLADDPRGEISGVVFESRSSGAGQNMDKTDQLTISRLQDSGVIPTQMGAVFISPAVEPVLWSADLTAWAAKRALDNDEPGWIRDAGMDTRWIDAQTNRELHDPTLDSPMKFSTRPQPSVTRDPRELMQGLADHQARRGVPRTEVLRELTEEIRRLPADAKHREDLNTGRGRPSTYQQRFERRSLSSTKARQQAETQSTRPNLYSPQNDTGRKGPQVGPGPQRGR